MTIFLFNIKRMLTRKKWFISIYILPIVVSFIVGYVSFELPKLKIGIVDNDNTRFTRRLIDRLGDNYKVKSIAADDVSEKVSSGQLTYAIVIDKGFTSSIIFGKDTMSLSTFYEQEGDTYKVVDESIKAFIADSKKIALTVKDEEGFYRELNKYISKDNKYFETDSSVKMKIAVTLNFLVMFMLFNAFALISEVVNKKDDNIRVFAAPLTLKSYMLQNILSLFILELVQVIIMFIALAVIYNAVMMRYFVILFLLFAIFSFVAVALALMINYFSSIYLKKKIASSMIIIPMCMFGGCFWGIDMMPSSFKFVSQFLPTTWITTATFDVLVGKGFENLMIDITMLFLFAIVFLLLGVFTKKDIVN